MPTEIFPNYDHSATLPKIEVALLYYGLENNQALRAWLIHILLQEPPHFTDKLLPGMIGRYLETCRLRPFPIKYKTSHLTRNDTN